MFAVFLSNGQLLFVANNREEVEYKLTLLPPLMTLLINNVGGHAIAKEVGSYKEIIDMVNKGFNDLTIGLNPEDN